MKLTLKGNPRSTGAIYRYHSRGGYITKLGRQLKNSYIAQLTLQHEGEPISEAVEAHITLYFGDKRKRDWDNFHKLSMDALEGIVLVNDNQIQVAHVFKDYDKENPRIEIEISEYKEKLKCLD